MYMGIRLGKVRLGMYMGVWLGLTCIVYGDKTCIWGLGLVWICWLDNRHVHGDKTCIWGLG